MTSKVTISVRLDPQIWKKAKIFAATHDLKIGEVVEKALEKLID